MIPRDFRIVPTAALTATFVAALAFVLMFPRAALWIGVLALVLAVCGLFTLAAETVQLRQELADAERKHEALEDELATEQRKAEILRDALMVQDQVSADLAGQLQDAEIRHLHAVRDVPVADEPVPIHDRLLIDHWIEDVQTWGEDAES